MIDSFEINRSEFNVMSQQSVLKKKDIVVAQKIFDKCTVELKISAFDNELKNKPAMVFLHGIGASKKTFQKTGVLQAFENTHHVVALDLLGHGKSTMIDQLELLNSDERDLLAEECYSLPPIIDQVAKALKLLEIRGACIFGWSIGGHVTHGLAIKHPELVSSIITTGTPSINYAENELKRGFSEWFVDNIVSAWMNEPNHYSRADSEVIIQSMGYSEVKDNGCDVYVVNSLMKADPLFRKYLYLTLPSHVDKPELYGRKFLEENRRIPVCMIEGEDDAGCVLSLCSHILMNMLKKNMKDLSFIALSRRDMRFFEFAIKSLWTL